jgi:hypothetical protein
MDGRTRAIAHDNRILERVGAQVQLSPMYRLMNGESNRCADAAF